MANKKHTPEDMFTIDAVISGVDGALVIYIDTDAELLPCNSEGPAKLRVYINDGDPIYANPDFPVESS